MFSKLKQAFSGPPETVSSEEVIVGYTRVLYSLFMASQEKKNEDPTRTISNVMALSGAWMVKTTQSPEFSSRFAAQTTNQVYLNAIEQMGIDLADDLEILEEYEEIHHTFPDHLQARARDLFGG